MNKNKKGIVEIKVKLLPEKAKRDYFLRLVSMIIIMIFVIINFFVIFLPRRNLFFKINNINRGIYTLESSYNNLYDKLNLINKSIYDLKKNGDVSKLKEKEIDYVLILNTLSDLKPHHSFIENINYNNERKQLSVSVQFDTLYDLTSYQKQLEKINYFTEVKVIGYTIVPTESGERYKANFLIIFNTNHLPKVGDLLE